MNARLKPVKPHRQDAEFPALSPAGRPVSLPAWNYAANRLQIGRLANGGCLYGGQTAGLWGPLRDLLHITDGPSGCAVYAHAQRPQPPGPMAIATFSGVNLGTDFQERDVVFGGEAKLARAIAEADRLFPLRRGTTVLSTCPVALIGDDLGAVAKTQSAALGQPVVAVNCAGFRRGDGIGETHASVFGTWRDWAAPEADPGPYDVVLLCREVDGAWRGIVRLLEEVGLRVVARWPGGGGRDASARLGHGRLAISIEMEYWARQLQRQFGTPWIGADLLGPSATAASLRAIAARFDAAVRCRTEAVIARAIGRAEALVARARARLAGRLYFSFAPLDPSAQRAFTDFGIRIGSALQGWPGRDGNWVMPARPGRYHELTPAQVEALLDRVRPDLVDGLGQDRTGLLKLGYPVMDEAGRLELALAAVGFAGTERLAGTLLRLFDPPLARLRHPPWTPREHRA